MHRYSTTAKNYLVSLWILGVCRERRLSIYTINLTPTGCTGAAASLREGGIYASIHSEPGAARIGACVGALSSTPASSSWSYVLCDVRAAPEAAGAGTRSRRAKAAAVASAAGGSGV